MEIQALFKLIDSYTETNIDLAFALMAENAEWQVAFEQRYHPLLQALDKEEATEQAQIWLLAIGNYIHGHHQSNRFSRITWARLWAHYAQLGEVALIEEYFRLACQRGNIWELGHARLLQMLLEDTTAVAHPRVIELPKDSDAYAPAGEFRADVFEKLKELKIANSPHWALYLLPHVAQMPKLQKLHIFACEDSLAQGESLPLPAAEAAYFAELEHLEIDETASSDAYFYPHLPPKPLIVENPIWAAYFWQNLSNMPKLQTLIINACKLPQPATVAQTMPSLSIKSLTLNNAGLQQLPAWLYSLRLEHICLDSNELQHLDSRLWAVAQHIVIRNNPILSLLPAGEHESVDTLVSLELHANQPLALANLPALPKLSKLSLFLNSALANLPKMPVFALKQLFDKSDHSTPIDLPENWGQKMPSLEEYNLGTFSLARLPAYLLQLQQSFKLRVKEILSFAAEWEQCETARPYTINVATVSMEADAILSRISARKWQADNHLTYIALRTF